MIDIPRCVYPGPKLGIPEAARAACKTVLLRRTAFGFQVFVVSNCLGLSLPPLWRRLNALSGPEARRWIYRLRIVAGLLAAGVPWEVWHDFFSRDRFVCSSIQASTIEVGMRDVLNGRAPRGPRA